MNMSFPHLVLLAKYSFSDTATLKLAEKASMSKPVERL